MGLTEAEAVGKMWSGVKAMIEVINLLTVSLRPKLKRCVKAMIDVNNSSFDCNYCNIVSTPTAF